MAQVIRKLGTVKPDERLRIIREAQKAVEAEYRVKAEQDQTQRTVNQHKDRKLDNLVVTQ